MGGAGGGAIGAGATQGGGAGAKSVGGAGGVDAAHGGAAASTGGAGGGAIGAGAEIAARAPPQVGQNFCSAATRGVPQLGQKPNPVAILK